MRGDNHLTAEKVTMISHIDKSLETLLQSEVPAPEFDISFEIPTKDWAGKLPGAKGTLNVYLYEIVENRELRNNHWEVNDQSDGKLARKWPVVRLDLFYILTAWSSPHSEAHIDEHHLLSKVVATLFKFPTLPSKHFQGELATITPPCEIPMTVAGPDAFKEQGAGQFWSAIDQYWKPFVPLTVTIPVDLQDRITQPVSKVGTPPEFRYDRLYSGNPIKLSGIIRKKGGDSSPVAGAEVVIVDSEGKHVAKQVTKKDGKFSFINLTQGKYLVSVTAKGYKGEKVAVDEVFAARGNELTIKLKS